jgi:SAM-dependent methyltransferase
MSAILDRLKTSRPYLSLRKSKRRLERLFFERGLIDTGGRVELDELGLGDPERVDYDASDWSFMRRAMRRCEVRPTDVFVDFGSGKGRVLWQAAQFPFARVVGVELSEELSRVARQNLDNNLGRLRCQNIEVVTADATEYDVPDDMTFAYMYSPFRGKLFEQVVKRIIESIDRNPRRVTLIYANPVMEEELLATGRFTLVEVLKGVRPDIDRGGWVNLYEAS